MEYRGLFAVLLVIGCSSAQISRVCVPTSDTVRCQNMNRDGSQVSCELTATRVECANKLARNAADIGYFSDEELKLLAQMPANSDLRVIAQVRNINRQGEQFSFETVAVVPNEHQNGFAGLSGGRYCHPGFGAADIRWSPRVLRALEVAAARTDVCNGDPGSRTAEELEVATLNSFFSAACRPGPWSANSTIDADLKARFPNLCSLCTAPGVCAGYNIDNSVNVAGVQNSNRHIQALECLRTNGTVAYVAWAHVREYFRIRNPDQANRYSLLCENGTLAALTPAALDSQVSPCSLVRQPWGAIVTTAANAESLLGYLRIWWPLSQDPGGNSWESSVFNVLAGGSTNIVNLEQTPVTPSDYLARFGSQIPSIDSTTSCLPARRWCTVSAQEQNKCNWVRAAAYSLGLQPPISCQLRTSSLECLNETFENRVDFMSLDSHYGYLARRHYNLNAVKLVQNLRDATSRVAALIKERSAANITRFGNLKDGVACFPEYGSLAYVAFLRTAHERSVISRSECNYARAVGEFFSSACAPGANSHTHAISDSSEFNNNVLCQACRSALPDPSGQFNFTCAYNWTNAFFGNNGSVNCLTNAHTDVAIVELQNIRTQMQALNVPPNIFRVLCRNDSLAVNPGIDGIDDACLLTHVVDAEVLARRDDNIRNSINALLDALDDQFGYNTAASEQLINLHLFSSFDGVSNLLFKDSTIGLTEPTRDSSYNPARNYVELFTHLESCTNAAPPSTTTPGPGTPGHATRNLVSMVTMIFMGMLAKFVVC